MQFHSLIYASPLSTTIKSALGNCGLYTLWGKPAEVVQAGYILDNS
jgi:hypothetical protein